MELKDTQEVFTRVVGCNKRIKHCKGNCNECKWNYVDKELFKAIDVVMKNLSVKHGYWKHGKNDIESVCSVCKATISVPTLMDKPIYQFCPCCGAMMEIENV